MKNFKFATVYQSEPSILGNFPIGHIKEVAGNYKVYVFAVNPQTCEHLEIKELCRSRKELVTIINKIRAFIKECNGGADVALSYKESTRV